MKLYSAGDQIREGHYRLLARYAQAATYIDPTDALLFAVTPAQGAGPLNLVTDAPDDLPDELSFLDQCLRLKGHLAPFRPDRIFRSSLPPLCVKSTAFCRAIHLLKQWLLSNAPEESLAFLLSQTDLSPPRSTALRLFRNRAVEARQALRNGDLTKAARRLRGCGSGLTPAGDDFIAGMLLALRLIAPQETGQAARIFRAARGKNPVVNAFLTLARDGFVFERFHLLLDALQRGAKADVEVAAKQLSALGATSGVDLAVGFVLTWEVELKRIVAGTVESCL